MMKSKIRRSVSMSITEDSRIFESSPIMKRKRSLFKRKNLETMAKFKSKLSIDSDWSVISAESSTSLHSLRDRSLTSLKSSKSALGTKLQKVKTSLTRKLRRAKSKTKIIEVMPQEPASIQCKTVYNHILANQQEYVEEYDLVIWEEAYNEKPKFGEKLKNLVK